MDCRECGAHMAACRIINLYTARIYKAARCGACGSEVTLNGRNMRPKDVARAKRTLEGTGGPSQTVFGSEDLIEAVEAFVEGRGAVPKDDGFIDFLNLPSWRPSGARGSGEEARA